MSLLYLSLLASRPSTNAYLRQLITFCQPARSTKPRASTRVLLSGRTRSTNDSAKGSDVVELTMCFSIQLTLE